MSIPKIIHYVWLGPNNKSKLIIKCMKTWNKHLKDYKIVEWNENNFDINKNKFVKQAYEQKKWAYASDYIRAYAIYNYGGIYLDTDVIILDNFEKFLNNRAFVGFENEIYPFTAVFGAEREHAFVKDILDYYNEIDFEFNNNDKMSKVNTKIVSEILINKYKCIPNNKKQLLQNGIMVYPDNVLCNPSKESSAIHIFNGTWLDNTSNTLRNILIQIKLKLTTRQKAFLYDKIIRKRFSK